MFTRRCMAGVLAALMTVAGTPIAMSQGYPSRPIKVVMPSQPGSGNDLIGRLYANQLAKELGQAFVVDNRVGAGGNIGAAIVAKAPADGYTLLAGSAATHASNPSLFVNPGYDPERDFVPLGILGRTTLAIAASPRLGVKTIPELLAKSRATRVTIALPNTTSVLVNSLLVRMGNSGMMPVPYKGSGAAFTDVLGGHVDVVIDTVAAIQPHANAGNLIPLGVTTRTPSELFPTVKPIADQGLSGFDISGWYMLFAPAGTPSDTVAKLHAAIRKASDDPGIRKQLIVAGFDLAPVGELASLPAFISAEREKWGRLVKDANLKPE
jgi:tripartite-type tricarboxylate transporter receptor subunit TctC